MNPSEAYEQTQLNVLQTAARSLKMTVEAVAVRQPGDFDSAFTMVHQQQNDALIFGPIGLNLLNRSLVVELVAKSGLPAIHAFKEVTEVGGLMSYGANRPDQFHRAAAYVGKILNGLKPADLPVMQPTKFEFVINLKTAKALGLTVPPTLLALADEVIE